MQLSRPVRCHHEILGSHVHGHGMGSFFRPCAIVKVRVLLDAWVLLLDSSLSLSLSLSFSLSLPPPPSFSLSLSSLTQSLPIFLSLSFSLSLLKVIYFIILKRKKCTDTKRREDE